MQIEIKPDRICNVHLPKVIKHLLLKTKVVTRLSFTKTLASLLTNITVQQEVKPPPEQFNSTLENSIQILISADTRSPDTLYKLPSKVTDPLLGLLFLRALSCRLCWVCLLSMWSHGAVADGQQTPELLVFNLHQERDVTRTYESRNDKLMNYDKAITWSCASRSFTEQ